SVPVDPPRETEGWGVGRSGGQLKIAVGAVEPYRLTALARHVGRRADEEGVVAETGSIERIPIERKPRHGPAARGVDALLIADRGSLVPMDDAGGGQSSGIVVRLPYFLDPTVERVAFDEGRIVEHVEHRHDGGA